MQENILLVIIVLLMFFFPVLPYSSLVRKGAVFQCVNWVYFRDRRPSFSRSGFQEVPGKTQSRFSLPQMDVVSWETEQAADDAIVKVFCSSVVSCTWTWLQRLRWFPGRNKTSIQVFLQVCWEEKFARQYNNPLSCRGHERNVQTMLKAAPTSQSALPTLISFCCQVN